MAAPADSADGLSPVPRSAGAVPQQIKTNPLAKPPTALPSSQGLLSYLILFYFEKICCIQKFVEKPNCYILDWRRKWFVFVRAYVSLEVQ